jgi:hypothetical protein
MTDHHVDNGLHLNVADVAGYVSGTVAAGDRARIEAHLSQCEECTSEVAAVWRLQRTRFRRIPWFPVALAAAAAIAAITVLVPGPDLPSDVERDGERGTQIVPVAPAEGVVVAERPVFIWRRLPVAVTYRLTVSGEDGDSTWVGTTPDTSLAVPRGVALKRSARYYWYVDALLPDGRSLTTGIIEFRTGP